jgi:hypothetical protein
MAKTEIFAGVCGFTTTVEAEAGEKYSVHLKVVSDCKDIQMLAGTPSVLEKAQKHCSHASCPVPAAIIKTVEVAAGLALPADVRIRIQK